MFQCGPTYALHAAQSSTRTPRVRASAQLAKLRQESSQLLGAMIMWSAGRDQHMKVRHRECCSIAARPRVHFLYGSCSLNLSLTCEDEQRAHVQPRRGFGPGAGPGREEGIYCSTRSRRRSRPKHASLDGPRPSWIFAGHTRDNRGFGWDGLRERWAPSPA